MWFNPAELTNVPLCPPATSATLRPSEELPATAAPKVAESQESQAHRVCAPARDLPIVGAGDTATASRWWLIHYSDRDSLEVACCPEAPHAEILERHPDAVAAEPFFPAIWQPLASLTASEEAVIRAWLELIEETDPAIIAEMIGQCQRDADARDYFTGRAAAELPKPDPFPDDRRTCDQCATLIARRCQPAKRGEIVASRNGEPSRDLARRCEGYAPGLDDQDQRVGRARWPGLTDTKGTK